MDFILSLLQKNAAVPAKRVESFLEYFEDEDMRGITLTEKGARYIIESSGKAASEHGRIILDPSICERAALKFSKSDFLHSGNFHFVVAEIVEELFRIQRETTDRFTDDELLSALFEFFESRNCAGSIELLRDYASQIIERTIRGLGNELSTEELDFTTFGFKGFGDETDTKKEDEQ